MGKAIAEIIAWLGLRAMGVEDIATCLILFAMGVYGCVLTFGPKRWLKNANFDFVDEYPTFTRCLYFAFTVFTFALIFLLITQ